MSRFPPISRPPPRCADAASPPALFCVQACLVSHFEQLTPSCQCFVRQTVTLPSAPTPRVAAPSAAPVLAHAHPHGHAHSHPSSVLGAAPTHPLHQLSCLFLFTAGLLVLFLLVRCLVHALCAPRPVKKIALQPPLKTGVEVMQVQVAEPLAIKV